MSDVIEVIEKARNDYLSDQGRFDGTTREMIVFMLRAAEQAGWRLVPVEATPDMVAAIRDHLIDFSGSVLWHQTIEAAPRPWENSDE